VSSIIVNPHTDPHSYEPTAQDARTMASARLEELLEFHCAPRIGTHYRDFFEELIGDLADRGTTALIATHDLAAVERIADRAGILAGGRLLLDEEVEPLKQRFRQIWLPDAAAANGPALEAFAPLARVTLDWGVETLVADYDDERFRVFQTSAAGAGARVSALSLEEIFIALTTARDASNAGDADADVAAPVAGAKQ